jgi:hypothetical protein
VRARQNKGYFVRKDIKNADGWFSVDLPVGQPVDRIKTKIQGVD